MLIICAGMNRSGSTLQYQIAAHIAENYLCGERVGFVTSVDRLLVSDPSKKNSSSVVVKTHNYLSNSQLSLPDQTVVLTTYRDPRDMVLSELKFNKRSPRDAIALTVAAVGILKKCQEHQACFLYRYEEFFTALEDFVSNIANNLGVSLAPEEALSIAKQYEVPEQLARIQLARRDQPLPRRLGANSFDSVTLLHTNHISSATTGDWEKQLSPMIVAAIETKLHDWMVEHGYHHSLSPTTRRLRYALYLGAHGFLAMKSRLTRIARRFGRGIPGFKKSMPTVKFPAAS